MMDEQQIAREGLDAMDPAYIERAAQAIESPLFLPGVRARLVNKGMSEERATAYVRELEARARAMQMLEPRDTQSIH